jgi:ElaB/YqjD/DUF883 family membrane-anchored ribosome-binding protein
MRDLPVIGGELNQAEEHQKNYAVYPASLHKGLRRAGWRLICVATTGTVTLNIHPKIKVKESAMNTPEASNEKLISDIKAVVSDAEALLSATAGQTGEKVAELRASLMSRLSDAKNRLVEAEEAVVEKAKQAARATDDYVHENPWQSVIIAGGIGFIIGFLASRRN